MNPRDAWKTIHLLYHQVGEQLPMSILEATKLECTPDAVAALEQSDIVDVDSGSGEPIVRLNPVARQMVEKCLVASHNQGGTVVRVDYPQAFVIMPFSKKWSKKVYKKMIEPAVTEAGLECVRGDTTLRVQDLTANIWGEILRAGIVVADLSAPNVNVFYELGLAHALGKDTFVLNQTGKTLPADFKGAHYYEYSRRKLKAGKKRLREALENWRNQRGADKLKELYSSG